MPDRTRRIRGGSYPGVEHAETEGTHARPVLKIDRSKLRAAIDRHRSEREADPRGGSTSEPPADDQAFLRRVLLGEGEEWEPAELLLHTVDELLRAGCSLRIRDQAGMPVVVLRHGGKTAKHVRARSTYVALGRLIAWARRTLLRPLTEEEEAELGADLRRVVEGDE